MEHVVPMISSTAPSLPESRRPRLQRCLLLAVVLLPWCWLFGPSLLTDQTPAFRDAAHFHYPTFHWAAQQWQAKQIPLWNPQENLGSPTMSDLSSSLFYPPKLIFQLPLPFPALYSWYIALHVLLAAYGTYRLSRYWQASCWGASLAAVSYALSGSLLSQHANVIYLVSAAWLPFALQSTDQMLVQRKWRSALTLALLLTLMTLGGDPQSAYHVGLLAGLYALILSSRRGNQKREAGRPSRGWFQRRFTLLILAGSVTFLLSAIQVLPTWQWTRQSQRNSYTQPHSLYEIPSALQRRRSGRSEETQLARQQATFKGIFTTPAEGTHHRHIYHFSIGPWRFAELIWPNISGQMYPVHRRWINQLPGEGRVWSPTLYLGWLPLLLACAAWSLRSSDPSVRWLSYLVILSMLASLGWFGLGWLLYEGQSLIQGQPAASPAIGQPVGGLYWLLVQLFPGYVHFRYPAKWFVIASLGLSLLAGKQFDALGRQPVSNRLRRLLVASALVSGLGVACLLLLGTPLLQQLAKTASHPYWGPLESSLARRDILLALGKTALLSLCCWWLLSRNLLSRHRWIAPALVCLTAFEITLANGWLVVSSPDKHWQASSAIESRIRETGGAGQPPLRIFRSRLSRLTPSHWSTTSSWLRHQQIVSWDRNTFLPRYHLLSSHAMVESPGSIQSADYRMIWKVARDHAPAGSGDIPDRSILALLGVDYLIMRASPGKAITSAASIQFQHLEKSFPRTWISHEIVHFSPLRSSSPDRLRTRTEAIFFPAGEARDLRQAAVIESESKPVVNSKPPENVPLAENCQIVNYQPQQVTIEAQLVKPGLVVLSDTYSQNWRATVSVKKENGYSDPRPSRVYRTNRVMRGIYLPAGDYQITYRYHPSLFWTGSTVTLLACLGCVAVLLLLRKRDTDARTQNS
ncbi:MAG TPA: hypothetical protein EYN70_14125 [Planctomycetaceae bacterium]|nr:hypothetical protein [Planctomycetaceae bacterium]